MNSDGVLLQLFSLMTYMYTHLDFFVGSERYIKLVSCPLTLFESESQSCPTLNDPLLLFFFCC